MNNLNDPEDWNIRPERQGGGADNRWNYALLVPMLGLAALRWIWSRKFQEQIKEAKAMIERDLASQKKQLKEERFRIRLEREAVKYQTSLLFRKTLQTEQQQEERALSLLKDVEYRLVKRQEMFCSNIVHYSWRVAMEKELLAYIAKEPLLARLKMECDLRDIFQNDCSCAEYLNTDSQKNGSLMWLYLRYWKLQLTLQSHQRAEEAVLNTQKK